jgi:hypothetical protein
MGVTRLEEHAMGVIAVEGVVENGQVRLRPDVQLPEKARVFVIVPDAETVPTGQDALPRSIYPEQVRDMGMTIKEILDLEDDEIGEESSLMDYAGLGSDLWSQVDVDSYLEEERDSWDRF